MKLEISIPDKDLNKILQKGISTCLSVYRNYPDGEIESVTAPGFKELNFRVKKGKDNTVPFDIELFKAGLIDVPDGMTNVQVLKCIFADVNPYTILTKTPEQFSDWCNAPYKKGETT